MKLGGMRVGGTVWVAPLYGVMAHWSLLAGPKGLPTRVPALWDTNATATAAKDAANQTFKKAARGAKDPQKPRMGKGKRRRTPFRFLLGWSKTSLWIFATFLWTSIIIMMWKPCVYWGPDFLRWFMQGPLAFLRFCWAIVKWLHRWYLLEGGLYYSAVCLSAQSLRYPASRSESAEYVGFAGGMSLIMCWTYTVWLHASWPPTDGSWQKLGKRILEAGAAFAPFHSLSLAPLAWMHSSSIIGFFTVMAGYLGAVGVLWFSPLWKRRGALLCCTATSGLLAVQAYALRLKFGPKPLTPFATGICVFGHVACMGSVLFMGSKPSRWWGGEDTNESKMKQVGSVGMLLLFFGLARILDSPGLYGSAFTLACLMLTQKTMEAKSDGVGYRIMGKYVALCFLYYNKNVVLDSLNPANLYD